MPPPILPEVWSCRLHRTRRVSYYLWFIVTCACSIIICKKRGNAEKKGLASNWEASLFIFSKSVALQNEKIKTVCAAISDTDERRKLRQKQSGSGIKLLGNKAGFRIQEEAKDNSSLVRSSPKDAEDYLMNCKTLKVILDNACFWGCVTIKGQTWHQAEPNRWTWRCIGLTGFTCVRCCPFSPGNVGRERLAVLQICWTGMVPWYSFGSWHSFQGSPFGIGFAKSRLLILYEDGLVFSLTA